MKNKILVVTVFALVAVANLSSVNAISKEEEKVVRNSGGIAWVGLYKGAPFTWDRYERPVINISMNGSTTIITVGTSAGQVAGVSKFAFSKDQYTWSNMNKINPDIAELQKILLEEGFLGAGAQSGVYDEATKKSVELLQKKYGIRPAPGYSYGYFGPLTRNFLNTR